MKQILLTNDDGYESLGLSALKDALKGLAHITIVAPSTEKSACAHSLTLTRPLRFIKVDDDFFKLDDGTPSDCVYLALNALFDGQKRPDLVISGINKGSNMGEDITYSGTVAGAMEGVLQGIPSISISQIYKNGGKSIDELGYDLAKEVVRDIVERIFKNDFPLPEKQLLNINIPAVKKEDFKGIKVAKAGKRFYANDAKLNRNPRGLEYYWLGNASLEWDRNQGECDLSVTKSGFASITPIKLDLTAYEQMKSLEIWLKNE